MHDNKTWQDLVTDFHTKFKQPVHEPWRGCNRLYMRMAWLQSEVEELENASRGEHFDSGLGPESVVDVADALGDIIYLALGTAVEMGIPMDPVFRAIHAANMKKVVGPTGGKVKKPKGWVGPEEEIEKIIASAWGLGGGADDRS